MTDFFSPIEGNLPIKNYLRRILEKETIPHALLFVGPGSANKEQFACAFAKLIVNAKNSKHPDIREYHPEGKIAQHSIQSMRGLCEEAYLAPFQAKRKVFILHDADRMLPTSANALLKTLEEPSLDTIIIMLSCIPDQILPTILSRCQVIRFQGAQQNTAMVDHPLRKKILGFLASGRLKSYNEMVEQVKEINTLIEKMLNDEEKRKKTEIGSEYNDKLSALQAAQIDKEVDGAGSLLRATFLQDITAIALSWYRDLHLLNAGGDPSLLMNRDCFNDLSNAAKDPLPPLEKVLEVEKQTNIMLLRSAPLSYCLENFFLTLSIH